MPTTPNLTAGQRAHLERELAEPFHAVAVAGGIVDHTISTNDAGDPVARFVVEDGLTGQRAWYEQTLPLSPEEAEARNQDQAAALEAERAAADAKHADEVAAERARQEQARRDAKAAERERQGGAVEAALTAAGIGGPAAAKARKAFTDALATGDDTP